MLPAINKVKVYAVSATALLVAMGFVVAGCETGTANDPIQEPTPAPVPPPSTVVTPPVTTTPDVPDPEPPPVSTTGFKTYEGSEYRIRYPQDWLALGGERESIFRPIRTPIGVSFNSKVRVTIEDISTSRSLEEYTAQRLSELESGHIIFDDYMTTLDGYDAYQVTYQSDSEVLDVKFREIWTLKDNTLYLLEYSSWTDEFDESLGIAKAIISTFKIVDNPPVPPEPVFLNYENEEYGISILRPSDWTNLGASLLVAASFEAPDEVSSFEIRAFDSSSYRNFQEYVDYSLGFLDGLEIQDSGRITLDGAEAHQVVYTSADGGRGMEIWTIRGGMAYDLVYNSDDVGYYSHLGTIQRMIDSFEVDSPLPTVAPEPVFLTYETRIWISILAHRIGQSVNLSSD